MKKLLSYLPFQFLLCLILGIYLQFYTQAWQYGFTLLILAFLAQLLILSVLHYLTKRQVFTIFTYFLFTFIGITSVYIQDDKNYEKHYTKKITKNSYTTLSINRVLKSTTFYNKYEAKVIQVDSSKTIGKIVLNIQQDSLQNTLKVGQQLLIAADFKSIKPPLNPHQFNYKAYLARQGIHHQLFTKRQQFKVLEDKYHSLNTYAAKFRNSIQRQLKRYHFSKDEFAVINALLLGQRQEVSKELRDEYVNAGAIHILAISGLHIGILLLILLKLCYPLERLQYGKILKTVLIVSILWLFAFVAGLSASVVRAVTMFTFVAIGQSFQRKQPVEHSLIASMFFLLLIKPMFLFDVGFQLSYLAVFGIVKLQPLFYKLWQPRLFLIRKIWELTTVSLAAQIGVLPISLFYFHQFPSLFLLSNLVIVPFLGLLLTCGILLITLSYLQLLPQFLADVYGFVIALMNSFVSWVAQKEDFLLQDISMSLWLMLGWYLVIVMTYEFFIKENGKKLIYVLFALILLQSIYIFEKHNRNSKQELIIFHKNRASLIGIRTEKDLHLFQKDSMHQILNALKTYTVAENCSVEQHYNQRNYFRFKDTPIIVVDSLGIYQLKTIKSPIVLLQYSPKINLNRLISFLKPQQIIADGSNYKSYIHRWEQTCKKEKTPFHFTGEHGAFVLSE